MCGAEQERGREEDEQWPSVTPFDENQRGCDRFPWRLNDFDTSSLGGQKPGCECILLLPVMLLCVSADLQNWLLIDDRPISFSQNSPVPRGAPKRTTAVLPGPLSVAERFAKLGTCLTKLGTCLTLYAAAAAVRSSNGARTVMMSTLSC